MPLAANAPYLPRNAGRAGTVRSFALAFVVHGLLFAFLYFGIRWQSRPPAAIEAELWSEPPRPAVPAPASPPQPAPEPPKPVVREEPKPESEPAPRKPDIVEKEEKKKPEPKKKEEKPKAEPKRLPEKPNDDAVKAALDKELARDEAKAQISRDLQRDTLAQKAAADAAQRNQAATRDWIDQIVAKVKPRVPFAIANAVNGNPEVEFEITLLPNLEVLSLKLIKPSGNAAYDAAVENAIKQASPFPRPNRESLTIPRVMLLKTRPKDT